VGTPSQSKEEGYTKSSLGDDCHRAYQLIKSERLTRDEVLGSKPVESKREQQSSSAVNASKERENSRRLFREKIILSEGVYNI